MAQDARWRDWEDAWDAALHGPGGFVHTAGPAAAHFRTSVHVGPELAEALAELLARLDTGLGHPARLDVVDLGAGGGELLARLVDACPLPLRARLAPVAVDLRAAPPGWALPWAAGLPDRVVGLVVAHEWLDALACPVVEHDGRVVRRVQVRREGRERLGPAVGGAAAAWLRRWWPLGPGGRAEVGLRRDRGWAAVRAAVVAGLALAVDYGQPAAGPVPTLTGFRDGRVVAPVPDGRTDLTAHVHWPSLPGRLRTQADALAALGLRAGGDGSQDWLRAAARAGRVAELTDPAGLGGFGWLSRAVGVADPLSR
ncbi:SAM-dependent methyltransferase [Rhodococcus aerolatus]